MENRNELSDILLDNNNSNKPQKIKRVIVIATLLILIFIIVLVIMRFINKPDDSSNTFVPIDANITPVVTIAENITQDVVPNQEVAEDTALTGIDVPKIVDIKENIQPKVVVETRPKVSVIESSVSANDKKPEAIKTVQSAKKGSVYIQVGSFSNTKPNKIFLNSLAKKGYIYLQHDAIVKGAKVTKILVGPYSSDKEARNNLSKLKEDVAKDAFIYKIN